jgi:hypothetical protein
MQTAPHKTNLAALLAIKAELVINYFSISETVGIKVRIA